MKTIAALVFFLLVTLAGNAHGKSDFASVNDWLLAASLKWQPAFAIKSPVASESEEEHRARRAQIVADLWKAASDPATPVLFSGPKGREETAIFVLGVWMEESHFDLRVDKHHCAGLEPGFPWCDGGRAWCMGQIHPEDVPQLGYSGPELQADNVKCARATIVRLAAAKAGTPKDAPHPGDRFCGYAVGHYESPCPKMRLRYWHGSSWAKVHPAP